ncbi:hypothetical protein [Amycolatopsis nalaikhensis]|uniref:Uncharacterized protein n=1 Tax=Amycolatopsis nalaikhensis TaxID=715472 RepID=A0ABY8XUF8_9PSEU|nr:hypothetical protein [Amycolatopsis sp. 2-2]WIV59233.1 hypothetical protein QP939_11680 [Amycolatopsis sp. 2-2]
MNSRLTDAQRQTLRRRMLIELTKHQDPVLAECAREVLRGRSTALNAVAGAAYAERFVPSTGTMLRTWERTPEPERAEQAERFLRGAEEVLAQPEPELMPERANPSPRRREHVEDVEPVVSIMTEAPKRRRNDGTDTPRRQTWRRRF